MIKRIKNDKFLCLAILFAIAACAYMMIVGEDSFVAVHDNMDLFIAQYAMLRNTGSFFSHGVSAPFLGGVSRDVLPSEFSLYSVLYMVMRPYAAYIHGYGIKILIAVISFRLLMIDYIKDARQIRDVKDLPLGIKAFASLGGLLYGVLNVFPAYGIAFASIPLIIYFLRNVYKAAPPGSKLSEVLKNTWKWQLLVFAYPFVSYFSYFGFFILAYLVVAIIWLFIRDKRISLALVIALFILAAGNVVFEYRLFGMMLFSDTETIRETMVQTYYGFGGIMKESFDVFVNSMMHAEDCHKFFVMPICLAYLVELNIRYVMKRDFKGIFHDIYNLCFLILVFNALIYGLYYSKGMNMLVATILPPLKGFQFNRTIFFSPFLWCAMLFIFAVRFFDYILGKDGISHKWKKILSFLPYIVMVEAILIVLTTPTRYNDLLNTAKGEIKRDMGNEMDELTYGEFYSKDLFTSIKNDLKYQNEWAVAYGMHPAVLEYNGIRTLDGYLGFYPQSYKEQFRQVIAPALDRMEPTRLYYDEWGARCYLYSGTDLSIVMPTKSMTGVTDNDIYINSAALAEMGCSYIFSRIEISNAAEAGLKLVGSYSGAGSPYTIYVYTIVE